MTKIHSLSAAVALPELDIFTVPPTQVVIEKSVETEHRPTSTLNSSSIIEFNISTSPDEYILFYETYFYISAKIKLSSTTPLSIGETEWKSVEPVRNFMHSMIKMVEVSIGGKEITRSPQTYAYRAYLENLLGFEQSSKNSFLSSIGWKSDADLKEMMKPKTFSESEGKEFEFYGKLHTDLTFQNKAIIGGSNISVRILLHSPEFLF